MSEHARYKTRILEQADAGLIEKFYSEAEKMHGGMRLFLDRRPDFFASLKVNGSENHVLVVQDTKFNNIAASLIVSIKTVFVNGSLHKLGYLSGLLTAPAYRQTSVTSCLFCFFRQYSQRASAKIWLLAVFQNNEAALHLFSRTSEFLPIIKPVGEIETILFRKEQLAINEDTCKGITVRHANKEDLEMVMEFIRKEGRKRSFCPEYTINELSFGEGLLKDFRLGDLQLAIRHGKIIGMTGIWSQSAFRNWVVSHYPFRIKYTRPLLNLFAFIMGRPLWPPEGHKMVYNYICLCLIQDNNQDVFKRLLNSVMTEATDIDFYLIGFRGDDPLKEMLNGCGYALISKLLVAYWPCNKVYAEALNLSDLYIEIGGM